MQCVYSSPGPTTCGGCEGSYGHEMQDATRWAEWGFDYIKYDWCSYDKIVADELGGKAWWEVPGWRDVRGESKKRPYLLMRDCLLAQGRDIVYSFCQYLWRQKCEGRHYGEYAAIVPPHATKLIKTKPVDCPKCD